MSVDVDLNGTGETAFADRDLPAGRYCYHVGAGGELIILVDEHGEGRVERVYGPTAWHSVRGDVWRKGLLLQG
ncbi:hypothetical protein ACI8AF_19650 [Blastococcus sp. SYSU D00669]